MQLELLRSAGFVQKGSTEMDRLESVNRSRHVKMAQKGSTTMDRLESLTRCSRSVWCSWCSI